MTNMVLPIRFSATIGSNITVVINGCASDSPLSYLMGHKVLS